MKKIVFLSLFTSLATIVFCQDQKAVTDAGKKVILHSNGNWEYFKESTCLNFSLPSYNAAKLKIEKGKDYYFYFNKAWQYVNSFGEKNYDAIVNFEEAISMYPNYGGTYSDLGNCYRGGFKCYEKAEFYYTKAIEKGFRESFVYYNRAICNFELNKLAEMRLDIEMCKKLGWYNDGHNIFNK